MQTPRTTTVRNACLGLVAFSLANIAGSPDFASAEVSQTTNYPNRTVTLIVPFAPGGFPDTTARLLAGKLNRYFGRSFVVSNVPGAGGLVAGEHVSRAAPDGYTMLVAPSSFWGLVPVSYKSVPFDIEKNFAPVARLGVTEIFLSANNDVRGSNFSELIASFKAKPGQYYYGSPGVGSTPHIAFEAMKAQYGLDIRHIPYRGSGDVLQAMLRSEVSLAWLNGQAMQVLQSGGQGRVLGTAGLKRSKIMSNVPTLSELGFPDVEYLAVLGTPSIGVLAPAGTPDAILERLGVAMSKAALELDNNGFESMGIVASPGMPAEFRSTIRTDMASFKKAAELMGLSRQ